MFLFLTFSAFSFVKSLLPFFPLMIWFYKQEGKPFCFFTSACWFRLMPVSVFSSTKWWANKKQPLPHSMVMRIKCNNTYKALLQSIFIQNAYRAFPMLSKHPLPFFSFSFYSSYKRKCHLFYNYLIKVKWDSLFKQSPSLPKKVTKVAQLC